MNLYNVFAQTILKDPLPKVLTMTQSPLEKEIQKSRYSCRVGVVVE